MGHVNLDYLRELSGNNKDFEKIMMEQFIKQAPDEIASLETSLETGDWLSAKKIAHSLKSTVSYMGLSEELYPFLEGLEKSAALGNKADIPAKFLQIKIVCEHAVKEINAILQSTKVI